MEELGCMQVLDGSCNLVNDVLLVLFFEDVLSDDGVQVDVHVLEDQVNIFVIVCLYDINKLDDVLVVELL